MADSRIGWRVLPLIAIAFSGAASQVAAGDMTGLKLWSVAKGGYTNLPVNQTRATVVMFLSIDCPMSMDYGQRIARMANEFASLGVPVILVDSNRNESDADIEKVRQDLQIAVPIYRDPGAVVARLLAVVATPTAVVLDAAGAVRYKGGVDDSRDPARVKRQFVQEAVHSILQGRSVPLAHTRVLGCSIKR